MQEWLNATLTIGTFSLPFSPLGLLVRFVLPSLGIAMAGLVLSLIIRRITARYIKDEDKRSGVFKWSRRIIRIMVTFGILLSAGSLLGAEAWDAFVNFFRILNKPFFTTGNTRISVVSLILIVPVVAVASWTGKLVSRGLSSGALNRFGLDAEQSFTIGRLLRYAVMTLVFIFGLSIVGIDLSAIGVLFGVLGIGIGFGLQSLIADFFAGITLIGMGLVKEGDRIRVADTYDGIIRRIRLLNTEMVTFENETLIIPNGQLTGGAIHNFSYKDRRIVIVNEVEVSYDTDLEQAITLMESIASRNPWLEAGSETFVRVKAFAASGITMQLRTMIRDVGDRAGAFSWTNLEIWRVFKAEGIEIPFTQVVLHQADSSGDAVVSYDPTRTAGEPPSSLRRPGAMAGEAPESDGDDD